MRFVQARYPTLQAQRGPAYIGRGASVTIHNPTHPTTTLTIMDAQTETHLRALLDDLLRDE